MSQNKDLTVGPERVVAIFYRALDEQGVEIDSSARLGHKPLVFLYGAGNVMRGLEKMLDGKRKDDFVAGLVQPADAYGVRRAELVEIVLRSNIAIDKELSVGMQLGGTDPQGRRFAARIAAVDGDKVTLDRNHPLADKPIRFEVTVAGVRPATAEELAHGHPHGPGGHGH
jgi:FKBP-type peptidyl-prolyl cis-trans isomerase SlyD